MKKLFLSIGMLSFVTLFSCGTSAEKKQNDGLVVPQDSSKGVSVMKHDSLQRGSLAYVCPCGGCPEVKETKAGNCPKCGLELVEEKK